MEGAQDPLLNFLLAWQAGQPLSCPVWRPLHQRARASAPQVADHAPRRGHLQVTALSLCSLESCLAASPRAEPPHLTISLSLPPLWELELMDQG